MVGGEQLEGGDRRQSLIVIRALVISKSLNRAGLALGLPQRKKKEGDGGWGGGGGITERQSAWYDVKVSIILRGALRRENKIGSNSD